jgi:hypothetical protein
VSYESVPAERWPGMEPAYRDELATVYLGDVLEVLGAMPAGCVDAVVTDPPAGISFMGQAWDTFPLRRRPPGQAFADGRARPGVSRGQEHHRGARDAFVAWMTEVMAQCHRLLKPGGHALVWAIPRTSHWTATAIEDAGFEVRDVVHHLFGQGFPKSLDVGEAGPGWRGWGTALKPAAEHWVLARRPLAEPGVAANLAAHGAGALNIDGCRVATAERLSQGSRRPGASFDDDAYEWPGQTGQQHPAGRWPANVVLSHAEGCRSMGVRRVPTGTAVRHRGVQGGAVYSRTLWRHEPGTPDMTYAQADGLETVKAWECVEGCPVAELDRQSGDSASRQGRPRAAAHGDGWGMSTSGAEHSDAGGASRFFYVAKASTADRSAGLTWDRNRHPTVKPVELMRWLVRLVTPPGGLVLDCFAGSGSTLVAAKLEGLRSIGVERDPQWLDVCARRLAWAVHEPSLWELTAGGEGA